MFPYERARVGYDLAEVPLRRAIVVLGALGLAFVALVGGGGARADDETPVVARTRARLPELRASVERARGAKLGAAVDVRAQTDAAYRAIVKAELDAWTSDDEAAAESRMLARLGLVPRGWDLKKEELEVNATLAFAYYDVREKAFFVLKSGFAPAFEPAAMAHELQHALQDQRFDLQRFLPCLKTGARRPALDETNRDAVLSREFVIEGEANYVMSLATYGESATPAWIAGQAQISQRALADSLGREAVALGDQGGAYRASSELIARLPPFVFHEFYDRYLKGAESIRRIVRDRGWAAIDELYAKPPRSTAQMLHPEKLRGAREEPATIALGDLGAALGSGWKRTAEDTLGELGLRSFFEARGLDADAASGWRGDRAQGYELGDLGVSMIFATWDDDEHAKRAEAAIAKAMRDDDRESLVVRRERDVVAVFGAPAGKARALADAALEHATTRDRPRAGD